MNQLEQKKMRLKYIERERKNLLSNISAAQEMLRKLNEERQNIIMSQEE